MQIAVKARQPCKTPSVRCCGGGLHVCRASFVRSISFFGASYLPTYLLPTIPKTSSHHPNNYSAKQEPSCKKGHAFQGKTVELVEDLGNDERNGQRRDLDR